MDRICVILPYFGKFPSYFPLFLQSCRYNPTIDWLLLTDITKEYDYPENVRVVPMEFSDLQVSFQEKFDFPIVLHRPYKLCDFKPAYGFLFQEYLEGYDFWGHCDLDLIFGDLRKFFPEEALAGYDKVGHLGHLTLYRNTPEINTLFRARVGDRVRYQEVFTTENSCIFDEWDDLSINEIFLRNGKQVWLWNDFFDTYPYDDNLVRVTRQIDLTKYSWTQRIDRRLVWISWEDGKIFLHKPKLGSWKKTELAYAHFQKRDMVASCPADGQPFWCLPKGFCPKESPTAGKYIPSGIFHRLFNRKRWKKAFQSLRYRLIVATAPIRHKFRKKK